MSPCGSYYWRRRRKSKYVIVRRNHTCINWLNSICCISQYFVVNCCVAFLFCIWGTLKIIKMQLNNFGTGHLHNKSQDKKISKFKIHPSIFFPAYPRSACGNSRFSRVFHTTFSPATPSTSSWGPQDPSPQGICDPSSESRAYLGALA